jgi:phenylpropionate dioxygenase-like ring-hydroxylating dioxygenase large terminal subunit
MQNSARPSQLVDEAPFDLAPLRDVWYFASAGRALKRGRTIAKTMLGEPLVIGRDAEGKTFALQDLCPHRGMPLSCGRFDGSELECSLHGWRFSTAGECAGIPSLAEGQRFPLSQVRVKSYSTAEVQGNIWVFLGDNPIGAPPVPQASEDTDQRLFSMVETMRFRCNLDNAIISLIDPAHGPYVHDIWFWHGRRTAKDKVKLFTPSSFGFTMTSHQTSTNWRAYKLLGGKPETEILFQLPGVRIERTRAGRNLVVNMTAMTPLGDGMVEMSHIVSWTMPWLAMLQPVVKPFVRRFLGQDRDSLEKQQIGLDFARPMLLINDSDTLIKWYYRLKGEYAAARRDGREFVNPVTPRTLRWRT